MTKRRGTSKPPSLPLLSPPLLSLPALLPSLLYVTQVLVNYLMDIFSTLATSQSRLDLEDVCSHNSATTCQLGTVTTPTCQVKEEREGVTCPCDRVLSEPRLSECQVCLFLSSS